MKERDNEEEITEKVKGEICIVCTDSNKKNIILTSLKPEQQENKIKIKECKNGVEISFNATNIVEARAIINTLLRLAKTIEDALDESF